MRQNGAICASHNRQIASLYSRGVPYRPSVKFVFALLSSVGCLNAQTATLQGIVTDPSGSVIPKAQVSANGSSGPARTVGAGEDRTNRFTNLPPGDYSGM